MILILGILWAALILGYVMFLPYSTYYGPSPAILSWLGSTAGLATIGIPIFLTMMWLTQWFSDYRLPSKVKVPMRIGWVASLFVCGFMVFDSIVDHNESVKITETENHYITDQSIYIKTSNQKKMESFGVTRFFSTKHDKDGLVNDNIQVFVKKANGTEVTVEKDVSASGKDQEIAEARAAKINADYTVENNTILLPEYFHVNKSNKLRNQNIKYTIYIPEGKEVHFGPNVNIHSWEGFEESCNCDESKYSWIMGENGLYSTEWLAKYRATKTIEMPSVSNLNLEGNYEVSIQKGKVNQAVLSGRQRDIDLITYIPTEDAVSFIKAGSFYKKPKLTITTTNLNFINATTISELNITGFSQEDMEIIFDSRGELNAYIDVKNLRCELRGGGTTTLIGSGNNVTATLSYAKLNAEKYKAENIKISGDSRGDSKVYASEHLVFDNDINHNLKIFGNPKVELSEDTD